MWIFPTKYSKTLIYSTWLHVTYLWDNLILTYKHSHETGNHLLLTSMFTAKLALRINWTNTIFYSVTLNFTCYMFLKHAHIAEYYFYITIISILVTCNIKNIININRLNNIPIIQHLGWLLSHVCGFHLSVWLLSVPLKKWWCQE